MLFVASMLAAYKMWTGIICLSIGLEMYVEPDGTKWSNTLVSMPTSNLLNKLKSTQNGIAQTYLKQERPMTAKHAV
jgi:hypothetical protein